MSGRDKNLQVSMIFQLRIAKTKFHFIMFSPCGSATNGPRMGARDQRQQNNERVGVGILLLLLVRSPCKILEPYDNPFWDLSNGGERVRVEYLPKIVAYLSCYAGRRHFARTKISTHAEGGPCSQGLRTLVTKCPSMWPAFSPQLLPTASPADAAQPLFI
jgi:hypothetical protein